MTLFLYMGMKTLHHKVSKSVRCCFRTCSYELQELAAGPHQQLSKGNHSAEKKSTERRGLRIHKLLVAHFAAADFDLLMETAMGFRSNSQPHKMKKRVSCISLNSAVRFSPMVNGAPNWNIFPMHLIQKICLYYIQMVGFSLNLKIGFHIVFRAKFEKIKIFFIKIE